MSPTASARRQARCEAARATPVARTRVLLISKTSEGFAGRKTAMRPSRRTLLKGAAAAAAVQVAGVRTGARAQALDKLQFRLNWTLYGEHAPFFVALDK